MQPEDDTLDLPQVSKTQRKRAMLDLQALGAALVELSETRLAELDLPERLLDAILEAKRIAKFGALRRQLQYVGKLMRDAQLDVPAIEAKLEAWNGPSRQATAYLHLLERWRGGYRRRWALASWRGTSRIATCSACGR